MLVRVWSEGLGKAGEGAEHRLLRDPLKEEHAGLCGQELASLGMFPCLLHASPWSPGLAPGRGEDLEV